MGKLCDVDWDLLGRGNFAIIGSEDLSRCFDTPDLGPIPHDLLVMSKDINPILFSMKS